MHNVCTACAQGVHRFGLWRTAVGAMSIALAGCAPAPVEDTRMLRNPTVPIGAITRFAPERFAGRWRIETAAGDWAVRGFEVSGDRWSENGGVRGGRIAPLARGIFRITYDDAGTRDVWVVWIDPDHNTVAFGDPEGRFGAVATRVGKRRVDQITAARQVLDFNGYRTDTWDRVQ